MYQHDPVLIVGFPSVNQHDEHENEEGSDQEKDADGEKTVEKKSDGNDQRAKREEDAKEKDMNSEVLTYPICWFEDEESGTPLRWQLFAGVPHLSLSTYPITIQIL